MTTQNINETADQATRETRPPRLLAYHVAERGEKKFWTRIGAAWDHEDGKGLTVQLDLVPVNGGRIVLREPADGRRTGQRGEGRVSALLSLRGKEARARRTPCPRFAALRR